MFLEDLLGVSGFPDYPLALNGLQVAGPDTVERVAVAVDASEEVIDAATGAGADLLIVHHGLFWGGLKPVVGRHFRKLVRLMEARTALYSVHLPLDAHATVGNAALLARAMGLDPETPFGRFESIHVGWTASTGGIDPAELEARLAEAVGGAVTALRGGGERVERVGIVTGAGGPFVEEAAAEGLDALISGEGSHHTYMDARECGVHVLYGGHYATETFGVRALGRCLEEEFGLHWEFLDFPSGL